MLLKISSCIFSALITVSVIAQKPVEKMDTTRGSFKPTGIRIGGDVVGLIKGIVVNDFKGWEVNADVDFRNYYLTVEKGYWQREVILKNGVYTNDGNYWRFGTDINMLKKDPVKNMYFFGFRIGHSNYNEQLTYIVTAKQFGTETITIENKHLTSNWFELTTGMKVKIYKGLWLGYTARLKLFPGLDKSPQLQSYDIPGYGLTFKKPWWGINYYVMFRIPLRK